MATLTSCPTLKSVPHTTALQNNRLRATSRVSAASSLRKSPVTTCSLPNKPRDTSTQAARNQNVNAAAAADVWLSEKVEWKDDKRIQTQVTQVAEDTTTIRSLDWDRDRFDIEFGLQEGTTYNSYIIRGEKVALIDASHEKFRQLYMATLAGEIDPSTIEYIIVSHTEPDHSGLVGAVLDLAPDATVVGSKVCLQFLSNLVHKPFKQMVVGNEAKLDLGNGHELTFIMAPNLHWPDTIFTHDAKTNTLFTCDAFGMHYCTEEVFDPEMDKIMEHYSFYYECLMKANARSVLTAMRKTNKAELTIDTIANGHGPLLRTHAPALMEKYQEWSDAALAKAPASCAIFYTAGYGFSEVLAKELERGVTKTGVEVELLDLANLDTQEVVEAVAGNVGIIILSPPADTPMADRVATIAAAVGPKKSVLVAESYGGNDEPVDPLNSAIRDQNATIPIQPLKVKEEPSEAALQLFEESGTDLGQALSTKTKLKELKGAMPPEMAKALGKLSGGLYVVSAARGTAKSAMIASWVSQASFEPLGFTVAVAKDRAIEAFMQTGDTFVLNCLPEEGYAPIMKHFLTRFPPGADRFEGVKWGPNKLGHPVLDEAVAHISCKVVSRMEAIDHWVVYSEVVDGVVHKDERTATHLRKFATYY
eukprot:CAMPEP_0118924030 /NCGR_PEP_ID=MMETSP1169-20130426/2340_1 /TAXON_ID=36882 /ORGANISM="Pyramimonas obovata, Strain CCMP722" /LENGTH=646 /DNA_ID=CAMNT_0006865109 /DNA_START=70 /DNA_END=2010 /DNA_ORIENTATION=+